jgi:hypothetical protein
MHCLRQSAKYIRNNRTSGTTDGFIFTFDIRKSRSAGLLVNRTIKQRIKERYRFCKITSNHAASANL